MELSGIIILVFSQTRKQRHGQVKGFAQGHMAGRGRRRYACHSSPEEPHCHLGLLERDVGTYLLWLVAIANFQTRRQRSMYVKPLPVSLLSPISQSVK